MKANRLPSSWCLMLLGLVVALAPRPSAAQLAPTGDHYGGRPSDTGFDAGGPSPTGGYSTSVPLVLPPARGGLPIPLQIVSGERGFGAAGMSWDVPLSYVQRNTSYGHRRPSSAYADGDVRPREQVVLSLLGQRAIMVRQGGDWVAQRGASDLKMHDDNGTWRVYDGNGHTYSFTQTPHVAHQVTTAHPILADTGLWLLDSIKGPGGNSVVLTYDLDIPVVLHSPVPSITIDLVRISYNSHPTTGCFKHEINLIYDGVDLGEASSLTVIGERVLARLHKLMRVDVTSRASCGVAAERLRSYFLKYQVDPDTRKWRLASVQVTGRQGTPEESIALPVASYSYGTATYDDGTGPVLRYQKTQSIPFPGGANHGFFANTGNVSSSIFNPPIGSHPSGTRQSLTDVTGDGRPDLVYWGPNDQLWVARNIPNGAGTTFGADAPLSDTTLKHGAFAERSSDYQRFSGGPSGGTPNVDYVWRQAVDFNGDGRIDIVDASEEPHKWIVYLNTPDPGPSGVKWARRAISIDALYQRFVDRGLPVSGGYLPLSRRFTAHDYPELRCWHSVNGRWVPLPLNFCDCSGTPPLSEDPSPEQTYAEWEIHDVNGDGYPDVVFNSSPVKLVLDSPDPPRENGLQSCEYDRYRVHPTGTVTNDPDHPLPNRVEVAFNIQGVIMADATPGLAAPAYNSFSAPVVLLPYSACGVERWHEYTGTVTEVQQLDCTFADVNGDGILDRVDGTRALLGTGTSFQTAEVTLPGPLVEQDDRNHVERCTPPVPGRGFTNKQSAGLRDLTGDGIPDYVQKDRLGAWQVYVGTGAGFAPPIAVDWLVLSQEDEFCDGGFSNTTGGLFDVDGDGKPETLVITNGMIDVFQLAGGKTARTPEAGRLVRVDNGYGAVMNIAYASAKDDGSTPHQVPFPEIVVSAIETIGTQGLGGSLTATRYAYGGAELYFDSGLDAFTRSAYRRTVEMRVMPDAVDPKNNPAMAKLVDTYPFAPWDVGMTLNERFGRHLRVGRPRDVTTLAGSLGADPWALLSVDATSDARRIAGTHYDWQTRTFPEPGFVNDLCAEFVYPYESDLWALGWGSTSYDVCSVHGFIYAQATDSWRGSAAPPSANNVEVRTSVRSVDDLGRPTSVAYSNDLYRQDDDFCVDTTYATPTGSAERVLSAPMSRRVWDCGTRGSTAVFALEKWEYDSLSPGYVASGLPTGHTVERHATDDGEYLGTIRDVDTTYDAAGNAIQSLRVREDGARRTTTVDYDEFGLVPVHGAVAGSNTPTLDQYRTIDPLTLDVVTSRDGDGSERGTTFDGFGRPRLETVRPPGGSSRALASLSYLGFAGGDPLGRRVVLKQLMDPVDPSKIGVAAGRTKTAYFDELGRSRLTQVSLGADYANETLIMGARNYDALGRVVFESDTYPASQAPNTAYGTTHYFATDGSPLCDIRGAGPLAFTTVPDPDTERYPTYFTHSFANHQESMAAQSADSLQAGTAQNGVVKAELRSAIGRVLFRSTWRAGVRLEHEAFAQDHVGQLASMTRYQDPSGATNPVQWTWRTDSLGQELRFSEPGSAPQTSSYSYWGELLRTQWTPPSPEPPHSIVRSYDALGRVTHVEEQNGGATDPATINDYDYDVGRSVWSGVSATYVLGRMAHASAPTGELYLSYDELGRVKAREFTDEAQTVYVEQHTYHGDGSDASVELDLPDTAYKPERVDYGYDSAGRARSMLFSDGTSTMPLYQGTIDIFGRLRKARFGKASYGADYADVGRRLFKKSIVASGANTRSLTIDSYDAVGRELSRTEVNPSGGTQTASYDALGRLDATIKFNGRPTLAKWAYGYDPLGNVLRLSDGVSTAGATLSYDSTDRDRICRIGYGNGGLGGTACNVVHDSFGNVIDEPTRTGHNRLSYFNSGRVRSIDDAAQANVKFRYDGFGDVQELDLVSSSETRSDRRYGSLISHRTQSSGGRTTDYLSREFEGPGISISRRGPSGPWIFTHGEGRGNRFTTDENGNFVQDLDYQPYGETKSSGAQPGTPQYSSEQWNGGDALGTFGLVNLGARVYDPVIGRFLSRDPLVVARTASTTNPYAFALNDPLNRSDPSGLDPGGCPPDGLCLSNTPDDSSILLAGILGALWGGIDAINGTSTRAPYFAFQATEFKAYRDAYIDVYAQTMQNQIVQKFAEADLIAKTGPYMIVGGLLIETAKVFTAGDQEGGGGDEHHSDGHGGWYNDQRQPHHVGYGQQAVDVGVMVGGGKLINGVVGRVGKAIGAGSIGEVIGKIGCFSAETPVQTRAGSKPIAEVRTGDEVWSFDSEQRAWGWHEVLDTSVRPYAGPMVVLRVGTDEILATPNHPICVEDAGDDDARPAPRDIGGEVNRCGQHGRWVEAGQVRKGELGFSTNEPVTIDPQTTGAQTRLVYNLKVADAHAYVVGKSRLLVHNQDCKFRIEIAPHLTPFPEVLGGETDAYAHFEAIAHEIVQNPYSAKEINGRLEVWSYRAYRDWGSVDYYVNRGSGGAPGVVTITDVRFY